MQTPQTSPRNDNNKINLSVQTANMQQVGDHPPSLQPPCRGENLAPKRNGPAERNMKKPHPLLHQWKIRWRNITTCYMTYVPVSPEFGEAFISDLETGNVNNYINSFVASSSKSSIASPVDGSTPTDITLQQKTTAHMHPNIPILKNSPTGRSLQKRWSGVCWFVGLFCVLPQPSMPQVTRCKFQTSVLITLTLVQFNSPFVFKCVQRNREKYSSSPS